MVKFIKVSKNNISFTNDYCVKTVNNRVPVLNEQWLNNYNKMCTKNPYLVKIYDIDFDKRIITMENLGKVIPVERLIKDNNYTHLMNKQRICDIQSALNLTWLQGIEISRTLPKEQYFLHTDLDLHNIIMTEDEKIVVIDPDSFNIVNKLKYSDKYYMAQINLMTLLLNYYYV